MATEWKKIKLIDFMEFNPALQIKKKSIAKKIPMEMLLPFTRKISGYELAEFKGGSKFQNGDTLLARITPCLENGKTAFVNILEENEIAFGSTEFIVLRAKKEISDPAFIYYFVTSPFIRDIAIKSMVGSSGRQRVQQTVLENLEVDLPPLETQQKIAKILSALDEKIELNNKINENLHAQAQAIFKAWFVDFEPFGGTMPNDWEKGKLGDLIKITSGKRPKLKQEKKDNEIKVPIIGASSVMGYTDSVLFNEKLLIIGRVGTHGIVQRVNFPCWASDNTLVINSNWYEYIYQLLLRVNYENLNRGSTQPLITQSDIKNIEILIPKLNLLTSFEQVVSNLMKKVENNLIENQKLAQIRDILLPKLMSGELEV